MSGAPHAADTGGLADEELERLRDALRTRYEVRGVLGRGGMAVVYRARDIRHQRQVALKVLRNSLSDDGAVRFRREITLAAGLQHPLILPVFDSGDDAGRPWYTMPLVEGETLRGLLRRSGRLPIDLTERLLRDLASALAHAHSRGIVHRDLKPENVLLSGDHALIADFGIAKVLAAETNSDSVRSDGLTATGMLIGTPAYMSPEQLLGDQAVDHRADLYALGIIAYEMLAGATPFAVATYQGQIAAHLGAQPPALTTHRPEVPAHLELIVHRLLQKRPDDRFATADLVATAIAAGAAGKNGAPPRTTAAPKYTRSMWLGGVLVTAGILAAVWLPHRDAVTQLRPGVQVIPPINKSRDTSLNYFGETVARQLEQALMTSGYVDVYASSQPDAAPLGSVTAVVTGGYTVHDDSVEVRLTVTERRSGKMLGNPSVAVPRESLVTLLGPLQDQALVVLVPHVDVETRRWTMGRPPSSMKALREFHAGLDLMSQGDFEDARIHWDRAAQLDSTYMQPRLHGVAARMNLEQWAAADSLLQTVEQRGDSLTRGDAACVSLHRNFFHGRPGELLQAAQALAKAEPGTPLPYFFVGQAAVSLRKPNAALKAAAAIDRLGGQFSSFDWATWAYNFWVTEAYHQLEKHADERGRARRAELLQPGYGGMVVLELRALAAVGDTTEMEPLLAKLEALPAGRHEPRLSASLEMLAGELAAHGFQGQEALLLQRSDVWQHSRPANEQKTDVARFDRVRTAFALRRYQEARTMLDTLLPARIVAPEYLAYSGAIAVHLGDSTTVNRVVRQLSSSRLPYDFGKTPYAMAQVAAQQGNIDGAINSLKQAIDLSAGAMSLRAHYDLLLAPIWRDARFQQLMTPTD